MEQFVVSISAYSTDMVLIYQQKLNSYLMQIKQINDLVLSNILREYNGDQNWYGGNQWDAKKLIFETRVAAHVAAISIVQQRQLFTLIDVLREIQRIRSGPQNDDVVHAYPEIVIPERRVIISMYNSLNLGNPISGQWLDNVQRETNPNYLAPQFDNCVYKLTYNNTPRYFDLQLPDYSIRNLTIWFKHNLPEFFERFRQNAVLPRPVVIDHRVQQPGFIQHVIDNHFNPADYNAEWSTHDLKIMNGAVKDYNITILPGDMISHPYSGYYPNAIVLGYEYQRTLYSTKAELDVVLPEPITQEQRLHIKLAVFNLGTKPFNDKTPVTNKIGKILFVNMVNSSISKNKDLQKYYTILHTVQVVKYRFNSSIQATIDLMGMSTTRNTLVASMVKPMMFNYKKFNKKVKVGDKEQVEAIHTVVVVNPATGKDVKFLISDIHLLLPNLKGYNFPKERVIKAGSIVYVKNTSEIVPTQRYVVKEITRHKVSSPLQHNHRTLQKMDVVVIEDENTNQILKVQAVNLKLA